MKRKTVFVLFASLFIWLSFSVFLVFPHTGVRLVAVIGFAFGVYLLFAGAAHSAKLPLSEVPARNTQACCQPKTRGSIDWEERSRRLDEIFGIAECREEHERLPIGAELRAAFEGSHGHDEVYCEGCACDDPFCG